jgi:hypothetical protein
MARMALGAIGAAIGGYFGGSAGAQIGFAIGSAIGGMFEPPLPGPRLSDLTVQVSSYGSFLPITYGGDRVTGNVIWCTDLVEHTDVSDGKGGPKVEQHTYTVSCAIAINGREIGGIRKIWADAKLIYDISDAADGAAHAASEATAALMTVYLGTEDQLPDPTIEAHEGVGNVEAYRGVAYVVFKDMPLSNYGNRLPNFSFEMTSDTPEAHEYDALEPMELRAWTNDGLPQHSIGGITQYTIGAHVTTDVSEVAALVQEVFGPEYTEYIGWKADGDAYMSIYDQDSILQVGNGARYVDWYFNVEQPDVVVFDGVVDATYFCSDLARLGADPIDDRAYASSSMDDDSGRINGQPCLVRLLPFGTSAPTHYEVGNICSNYPPDLSAHFPVAWFSPHAVVRVERLLSPPANTCYPGNPCEEGIAELPGNAGWCISCDGDVTRNLHYEAVSGSFHQLQAVAYSGSTVTKPALGPVLPVGHANDTEAFWTAAAAEAGLSGTYGVDWPVTLTEAAKADDGATLAGAGSALLPDIVSDICQRSGLTEDEIDVTDLAGEVLGYTLTRQASGRGNLEPLARAFRFMGIESGAHIRFQHIDLQTSVGTVGADDLGATSDGRTEALVKRTRAQETELPSAVNVVYKARTADYQASTQSARRSATGSLQEVAVEVPIVLEDEQAASIAAQALYDAWAGRVSNEWHTSREFVDMEPGDPIALDDGELVHRVLITEKVEDGALINWKGRDIDPSVLASPGAVSPTSGGGSTVRFDGPMKLEAMDIPLLRPADDTGPHFLAAASGYRPSWRGGRAYISHDDGTTYEALKDMNTAATLGYAMGLLADFDGGNVVDESNTVQIRVHSGTLSSITRDQLLNSGNPALLGDEVIQFQRATLVSANVYELSGLLRYRLGTERAYGTHEIGERFVLLVDSTLVSMPQLGSEIGLAAKLKGVSFGLSLDDATAQDFTYTAANLTPVAPVQLAVGVMGDGSMQANWRRRSRHIVPWLSAAALPLGEASEQYLVTVLDGSTIVEQQTVTSPEATLGQAAGSYVLTQTQELAQPAFCLNAYGALMVGVNVDYRVTGSTHYAVAFDAAGAVDAQSAALGDAVLQVAHGTGHIYVLAYFLTGLVYADTTVYRLDASNVAATPVSQASAIAGDWQGVAFDGTDVWVSQKSTAELLKLDAATLSQIASYSVASPGPDGLGLLFYGGGSLWVIASGSVVVNIDPSTGAEVGRFTRSGALDLAVIGGKLYVSYVVHWSSGSTGGANFYIDIVDPSTYAVLDTIDDASGKFVGTNIIPIGSLIATPGVTGIKLIAASTGAVVASLGDVTPYAVAGVRGSELLLTWSPSHNFLSQVTRAYTLGAPTTPPDYSGHTLRVQQVSAIVGPGFAAEITIP